MQQWVGGLQPGLRAGWLLKHAISQRITSMSRSVQPFGGNKIQICLLAVSGQQLRAGVAGDRTGTSGDQKLGVSGTPKQTRELRSCV